MKNDDDFRRAARSDCCHYLSAASIWESFTFRVSLEVCCLAATLNRLQAPSAREVFRPTRTKLPQLSAEARQEVTIDSHLLCRSARHVFMKSLDSDGTKAMLEVTSSFARRYGRGIFVVTFTSLDDVHGARPTTVDELRRLWLDNFSEELSQSSGRLAIRFDT